MNLIMKHEFQTYLSTANTFPGNDQENTHDHTDLSIIVIIVASVLGVVVIFLVAVACFICYICCNPGALPTIRKQVRERWGRLCCRDVPVPDTGQIEPEAQGFPLDEIPFRNGMSMPISVQSHSLPPSAPTHLYFSPTIRKMGC